ncbi:hypothetical protein [Kytococcus sedentarius]|uniref:hypothetical protein n=1 Tax=Kytococcus sedentarius TaxID=1276 RepID=UPI00384E4AF2
MPTRANLYLSDTLAAWLQKRQEVTHPGAALPAVATHELETWRAHLTAELAATIWPLGQINLIADVLNGSWLLDSSVGRSVLWEVTDALGQHPGAYGRKWGVDEDDLRSRLEGLSITGNYATACAVAQWWEKDLEPTAEGWAQVGVRTICVASAVHHGKRITPERWAAPTATNHPFAEDPILVATASDGATVGLFVTDDSFGGYQVEYLVHLPGGSFVSSTSSHEFSQVEEYVPRREWHPLAVAGKKCPEDRRETPQVVLEAVWAAVADDQEALVTGGGLDPEENEDDARLEAAYADPAAWRSWVTSLCTPQGR